MRSSFCGAGRGPDVLYADEGWAQDFEKLDSGAFQPLNKFAAKDKIFPRQRLLADWSVWFYCRQKIIRFPQGLFDAPLCENFNCKIFRGAAHQKQYADQSILDSPAYHVRIRGLMKSEAWAQERLRRQPANDQGALAAGS